MKLIHRTITTLGIATLLGGLTPGVHAQPAPQGTTTLISQISTTGFYHLGGGGIYHGNFYHPGLGGIYHGNYFNPGFGGIYRGNFYYPGGGSFYRGYLNNQGNGLYQGNIFSPGTGSIYQGTFYYPNQGGNFHGLFYDPRSGRVVEGNFYNPGPSSSYQGSFYYPGQISVYPGNYYNPSRGCSYQGNSYDWGLGCFGQRDYKRSIEYYNQVIQRNPKLVDAYNKRALARFILGDKQGTIEDLRKAANLYLAQGDKSRYQETLETIRDIQPERAGSTTAK